MDTHTRHTHTHNIHHNGYVLATYNMVVMNGVCMHGISEYVVGTGSEWTRKHDRQLAIGLTGNASWLATGKGVDERSERLECAGLRCAAFSLLISLMSFFAVMTSFRIPRQSWFYTENIWIFWKMCGPAVVSFEFWVLSFEFWVLSSEVWGLSFAFWGLSFEFWGLGLEYRQRFLKLLMKFHALPPVL